MKNFESPNSLNIEPQTKKLEKSELLNLINKELFWSVWFENTDYSYLKNSPEDVSNLSKKHNTWEQFLNICKQELLNLA